MAAIEPMKQFLVHEIKHIDPINVPGLGMIDMSITNSVVAMMVAALIIVVLLGSAARGQLVPGRMQAFGEALYNLIDGTLVGPMIGDRGRPYIPFVFTIFMMVLVMNMMGLVFALGNLGGQEWTFTATAQLAVTVTLALITFLSVVVIGFMKNGLRFFKLFLPGGVPWWMLVPLALIEFISFMVRPLTLSMRLFGNMIGGHVVMNIFASFVIMLGVLGGFSLGWHSLGWLGAGLSFFMVVALTALEFIVAFLQAFVFAALACVYLNDVVNLDKNHH
jgi:F-type H+-transporting ATPase subunit a